MAVSAIHFNSAVVLYFKLWEVAMNQIESDISKMERDCLQQLIDPWEIWMKF